MNDTSGEFDFIRSLQSRIKASPYVRLGIGDDAAILAETPAQTLVTTDMLMEGTHFEIPPATPLQVGHKALAVNLSDIAAMGGTPATAFVSVALPRTRPASFREEVFQGIQSLADRFHVSLAGGDTNSWDGPFVIAVTVLGIPTRPPVLRSGAQPGDWIMVTGDFGGSLLGKHLNFTPRVREALLLQQEVKLHAMQDVSDGLSADLYHILEESRAGARLFADRIPISQGAVQSAVDGRTPLEHALGDGEDFELLFTLSPKEGEKLLRNPPFDTPLTHIGEITSDPRALLVRPDGTEVPLPRIGWTHAL
ncbi:MAG: thiamine-phosphate kinase [Planctomycetales bacterium]